MPGPLVKYSVVMAGKDRELLSVRARVLAVAGCETRLFQTAEETADALGSSPKPLLLVICHSSGHQMSHELRTIAEKSGVPTYYVERLTPPEQLIFDVCAILNPGGQQRLRTKGNAAIP